MTFDIARQFGPLRSCPEVELTISGHRRRRLLAQTAGLGAASLLLGPRRRAFAQAPINIEAKLSIANQARRAERLEYFLVREGIERGIAATEVFVVQQSEISYALVGVFEIQIKRDEQIIYVSSAEFELALILQARGLEIAPSREEVKLTVEQPLPIVTSTPQESLTWLLFDIMLEGLGISELSVRFKNFIETHAPLRALLDAIARAIRNRHFGDAAYHLRQFLSLLVARPTVAALEAALGREATSRLLKAVAARFVPFVGWCLFISCFLASVYRNWDRLMNARFP